MPRGIGQLGQRSPTCPGSLALVRRLANAAIQTILGRQILTILVGQRPSPRSNDFASSPESPKLDKNLSALIFSSHLIWVENCDVIGQDDLVLE
jgi:hypothetical protein